MKDITIEPYTDSDYDSIISLLVDSFKSKFIFRQKLSPENIKQILSSVWNIKEQEPGYLHLIARTGNKVSGVLLVRYGHSRNQGKKIPFLFLCRRFGFFQIIFFLLKLFILEQYPAGKCYLEHIAVDSSFRGQGIGEALLSHAENILREKKFKELYLTVALNNKAKHLYLRDGFQDMEKIHSPLKVFFMGVNKWEFMRKDLIERKENNNEA
ncbi:GNAT family N-acetyltransferase [Lacrimispora sp.]|uniref:GNAT family N-acetyltransferase n=1 Tax=Lacrimispora sp. TaxID=2719234 RepID=UPI0028AD1F33|nr:GNAT family N-acetyltransferase [Lacrimispora sp.]